MDVAVRLSALRPNPPTHRHLTPGASRPLEAADRACRVHGGRAMALNALGGSPYLGVGGVGGGLG